MEDDHDCEGDDAGALEALLGTDVEQAGRVERIRNLSDATLSHFYSLLSDARYVRNVSVLPLFEVELRRRGLPLGRKH